MHFIITNKIVDFVHYAIRTIPKFPIDKKWNPYFSVINNFLYSVILT